MNETRAATAARLPATPRRSPWLVPAGLMLLLAFLTINVLAHGPMLAVDHWIRGAAVALAHSARFRWLEGYRYAPAYLLVDLGNNQTALPVLGLSALIVAVRRRSVRPLLAAVAGATLLLGTVIPAKILIARPGPGLPAVAPGAMGVFPSGHAATSSVCLGLAAALLAAGLPRPARRAAVAGTATLCFLVGAALIWCDFHWFTDVVAAWALAALIVMAALRVTRLGGNSGGPAGAVRWGAAAERMDMSEEQSR